MIDGNPERDEEKTSGETRCSDGNGREANMERGINMREGVDMINMREERGIDMINMREGST